MGKLNLSLQLLEVAIFLVPTVGLVSLLTGADGAISWVIGPLSGFSVLYLILQLGILAHAELLPSVPGANDNASGVEVLLRVAAKKPSRVWFVVTGSQKVGMLGIQAFFSQHKKKITRARFLNIDNVGAGSVTALSSEGRLRARRADPDLLELAAKARAPTRPFRLSPTDATPLLARGLPAITLIGLDERGIPLNWNWKTDTIDHIDPTTIDRATEIARTIVTAGATHRSH